MNACLIYITAEDREAARAIGEKLVEERLAACVNILDGMESVYRWEGKIESAQEAVLIAKTREDLVAKLTERVRTLHSYDCPCIVALPIIGGNHDFLEWIGEETGCSSEEP